VSTATATATRGPGRPPATADEAESAALHRVASLAFHILQVLRAEGRGRYHSERQLRKFLSDSDIAFTSSDLDPALSLLAATGRLVRPHTGLGTPRSGWLPSEADRPAPEPARSALARLVFEVAGPGNGRSVRPTFDEIRQRLYDADVEVSDSELTDLLERLADVGYLKLVRRQWGHPLRYVKSGLPAWNWIDELESDIAKTVKDHSELGYTDLEELKLWLEAAGVSYDEELLGPAILHLMNIGRLQTPRADHWEGPGPRPTWYVEPTVHVG
jgi:hypothetical protein